jgi:hypothetical protein
MEPPGICLDEGCDATDKSLFSHHCPSDTAHTSSMTTAALIGIGSANHSFVRHEFSIDLGSPDSSSDYISPQEQDDALGSELSQRVTKNTKNKVDQIVQDHH